MNSQFNRVSLFEEKEPEQLKDNPDNISDFKQETSSNRRTLQARRGLARLELNIGFPCAKQAMMVDHELPDMALSRQLSVQIPKPGMFNHGSEGLPTSPSLLNLQSINSKPRLQSCGLPSLEHLTEYQSQVYSDIPLKLTPEVESLQIGKC